MPKNVSQAESRRLLLHQELLDFTGHPAFFQAPSSPSPVLKYPCTVYSLSDIYSLRADDQNYKNQRRYQLTYITKDPTDPLIDEFVDHFKMINFSRHFTSDNLNHYIYDLYY
jgi:hypothetical protein